jgi:hypothetical protein
MPARQDPFSVATSPPLAVRPSARTHHQPGVDSDVRLPSGCTKRAHFCPHTPPFAQPRATSLLHETPARAAVLALSKGLPRTPWADSDSGSLGSSPSPAAQQQSQKRTHARRSPSQGEQKVNRSAKATTRPLTLVTAHSSGLQHRLPAPPDRRATLTWMDR